MASLVLYNLIYKVCIKLFTRYDKTNLFLETSKSLSVGIIVETY